MKKFAHLVSAIVICTCISIVNANAIEKLASDYNEFQKKIGSGIDGSVDKTIKKLFSADLAKVINGKEAVSKRGKLKEQLTGAREAAGNWTITEKMMIPSADGKHCTIRYILTSEKAGSFDVMAVLSSADGEHIDRIDEIYYQVVEKF